MSFSKTNLKSRKGVAMEMAMLVMVVAFALGALMVTVALMQTNRAASIKNEFTKQVELENIGEKFCAEVKINNGDAFAYRDDSYKASAEEANGDNLKLTVKEKKSNKTVMIVEINKTTKKIEKWEIK